MPSCTFLGHRDAPIEIETQLQQVIVDLIINKKVDTFYIGTHGNFDVIVKKTLNKLCNTYPHIRFFIVLAYLPQTRNDTVDYSNSIFPDGLEAVPKKFAIIKRNEWMINKSDYVVTFVEHSTSSASKFTEFAKRKNKTVINIAKPI